MSRYDKTQDALDALTPEQYRVTQLSGTEPPGSGTYLHNKDRYLCRYRVRRAFCSPHRTNLIQVAVGPAFVRPISTECVSELLDTSHGMIRTGFAPDTPTAILDMYSPMARLIAAVRVVHQLGRIALYRPR